MYIYFYFLLYYNVHGDKMKKIFILFLIIFLCGCENNNIKNEKINNNERKLEKENIEIEDNYVDNNPITVGIYLDTILISEYEFTQQNLKDIGVFTTFFTNDEYLENSNKYTWLKYYNNYSEDISKYKIGYNIYFEDNGTIYNKNVLGPEAIFDFNPYIFIYLYDDINQLDGTWYSHVEENEVNENTIFSSIKLFQVSNNFSSPIKLTAFTYDSDDDFDEQGNYRGKSKYTITLIPK